MVKRGKNSLPQKRRQPTQRFEAILVFVTTSDGRSRLSRAVDLTLRAGLDTNGDRNPKRPLQRSKQRG